MQTQTRFYSFGPFCLDAHRLLLLNNDGKALPLAPRFIRTLSLLVQNQGVDLTKEYLMDQLWPKTAVEENNLTVIISTLRKSLGEDAQQHQYIVTIPGKGYRFVADVIETVEPPAKSAALATASTTVLIESRKPAHELPPAKQLRSRSRVVTIGAAAVLLVSALLGYLIFKNSRTTTANTTHALAVLPFQLDGFGSDGEYLEFGMADALVSRLRNIPDLSVRPTEDVLAFSNSKYDPRDAGHALNVGTLVLGSLHKSGNNIDVDVKLVRVSDAAVLWSAEFKGETNQLLSIQNRIANQVASAVTLRPAPKERVAVRYSQNPEAYDLYLRGEYFLTQRSHTDVEYDLYKAVEFFNQAIEKDQNFALAYAALADAYNKLSWYLPADQSLAKAKAAAQRALILDPNLAPAYRALAVAIQVYDWDLRGADAAFRRSIELDPNDPVTHIWRADELVAMGKNDEAVEEWQRVQKLDPFSTLSDTLGLVYFYSRDYRDAFLEMKGKQDADPDVFWYLAWIHNYHLPELGSTARQQAPTPGNASPLLKDCQVAYANAMRANPEGIRPCIKSLQKDAPTPYVSPFKIALLYIAIKDNDSAFYWLEQARRAHSLDLCYLKVDPRVDDLRADARFNKLLEEIGQNR